LQHFIIGLALLMCGLVVTTIGGYLTKDGWKEISSPPTINNKLNEPKEHVSAHKIDLNVPALNDTQVLDISYGAFTSVLFGEWYNPKRKSRSADNMTELQRSGSSKDSFSQTLEDIKAAGRRVTWKIPVRQISDPTVIQGTKYIVITSDIFSTTDPDTKGYPLKAVINANAYQHRLLDVAIGNYVTLEGVLNSSYQLVNCRFIEKSANRWSKQPAANAAKINPHSREQIWEQIESEYDAMRTSGNLHLHPSDMFHKLSGQQFTWRLNISNSSYSSPQDKSYTSVSATPISSKTSSHRLQIPKQIYFNMATPEEFDKFVAELTRRDSSGHRIKGGRNVLITGILTEDGDLVNAKILEGFNY